MRKNEGNKRDKDRAYSQNICVYVSMFVPNTFSLSQCQCEFRLFMFEMWKENSFRIVGLHSFVITIEHTCSGSFGDRFQWWFLEKLTHQCSRLFTYLSFFHFLIVNNQQFWMVVDSSEIAHSNLCSLVCLFFPQWKKYGNFVSSERISVLEKNLNNF